MATPLYAPSLCCISCSFSLDFGAPALFLNGGGLSSFGLLGIVDTSEASPSRTLFRRFVGRLDLKIGFLTADSSSELLESDAVPSRSLSEIRISFCGDIKMFWTCDLIEGNPIAEGMSGLWPILSSSPS